MAQKQKQYTPFTIPCVLSHEAADALLADPSDGSIEVWHKSSGIFEWAVEQRTGKGNPVVQLDFKKSAKMYIPLTLEQFAAFMKKRGYDMPSVKEMFEEAAAPAQKNRRPAPTFRPL
jgi:hypothetical protein